MYNFDIAPIVWQRLAYKGVLSFKKSLFYSIQVRQDASSNDKWRSEIVEASNHKRMSCSWIHVPEKCNCCIARFQWDYSFSAYAKYSRKLTFLTPCAYQGVRMYSRMEQVKFVEDNLKNWGDMVLLSRPYHLIFLKGSLPQILLGPFLNTLS